MSVTPSPIGGFAAQFFDNNGVILSGGKIYTYAAGTTTPQATYTSASGVTPHANPIILDSAGRVPGGEIWLTDGLAYKFVIETATSILLGTYDNITGINDPQTADETSLTPSGYTTATNVQTAFDNIGSSAGATKVGYIYTGGVAQPVATKLAQTISVKDFGAVGDGTTDDTAAIQAALNSGAKKVILNSGDYKTTAAIVVPSGVSFVGEGQRVSKIKKSHTGDGITLTNALAYNGLTIGGFSVYAPTGFTQTGTGFKATQIVRTTFDDINVSDCAYGFSIFTGYANNIESLTVDRCGVGVLIQTSNHNAFNVVTIISDTGFTGVEMSGVCYSNIFTALDVEYALYPLWLKSGVNGVMFSSYYAEFNTNGARLDAGVKNITFDGVFNSTVPMFDTATFAATSVTVNGLTDDFPVGVGGVSIGGSVGDPGINTTQKDMLFQSGALSAAYDFSDFSKFGVNVGSHFEWTGEPRKNYVNSQDLSSGAQWAGTGTVTAVGTATIGGATAYRFAAGAFRTHSITVDTAMAGRTFTVCALVSGVPGSAFDLRQGDNVTETRLKKYVIGSTGQAYVYYTSTWGAGSTGSTISFTLINTGATTVDFALACIWEAPGPMPLTTRTRNEAGYTSYSIATFQNFGASVRVFGSAAPVSGAWKVGDVVTHTTPAAAGFMGWVCTTAGSPGTWKTFGAISA